MRSGCRGDVSIIVIASVRPPAAGGTVHLPPPSPAINCILHPPSPLATARHLRTRPTPTSSFTIHHSLSVLVIADIEPHLHLGRRLTLWFLSCSMGGPDLLVMRNGYLLVCILAVSAIHSEALVAPGSCTPYNHVRLPTQNHVTTLIDVPGKSSGLLFNDNLSSINGKYKYKQQHDHGRFRTKLYSSVINGNTADSDELLTVNEFQPRTMRVSESFVFFARFVVQTILNNRNQQSSSRETRRRLRDRIFRKTKQELSSTMTTTTATTISSPKPKRGFRESMHKLNESRKSLIRLVGYDSSLLVPAFGYLIMGAFMSSVIPYFYSSCISCVAAGEANRDKLLWALGGLGVSHVLEAVFTGLRGALFWIAGEYVCLYRNI